MKISKFFPLWFHTLLFCLIANQSATQEDVRIPVCKDDQLYSLPQYGQLRSNGNRIKLDTDEKNDPTSYIWKVGQPPLILSGFYYNDFGGPSSSHTPPLMELLLGKKSKFSISQLSVGSRLDSLDWYKPSAEQTTQSTMKLYTRDGNVKSYEINIRFFDRIVSATCRQGLPGYSNDPQSNSCILLGRLPDSTAISVAFATGNDLEGHWPPVSKLNELWPAAINELEHAIQELLPPPKGENPCN